MELSTHGSNSTSAFNTNGSGKDKCGQNKLKKTYAVRLLILTYFKAYKRCIKQVITHRHATNHKSLWTPNQQFLLQLQTLGPRDRAPGCG